MTPLFKKLNYKGCQEILVLNAPSSFTAEMQQMSKDTKVLDSVKGIKAVDFTLVFASKQKEVDAYAKSLVDLLSEDAVFWMAYPKGSSKKYTCDFNRDTGWTVLGTLGYEPVKAIAIDEDWSALRFRKPQHIKKMTRSFAMTSEGKQKVSVAKRKR